MKSLKKSEIRYILNKALDEDKAFSDITSRVLIDKGDIVKAKIICRENCLVCGINLARFAFKAISPSIKFKANFRDGQRINKGASIARLEGRAGAILSAERTALNFLSHLSGIATLTYKFVQQVFPYRVQIMDTRKTLPGLRSLEKYAVRVGGGKGHRGSLREAVLIKTNHLKTLQKKRRGIGKIILEAVSRAKKKAKAKLIEIEVKNICEFKAALVARPDIIMLDNWRASNIAKAARLRNRLRKTTYRNPLLEVSGGVTLDKVRKIAACRVERISVGVLTHSAPAIDFSLKVTS